MAVIKCKMCGGDMTLSEDRSIGMCEYCGSTMTLPKVSDEQRAAQFNRGNHFRRQGEFDKALAIYENIVREDDNDAEAHWCCALCRFGIEYVEDPATYEYIPTCHRASFDSILEDVDYLAAVEHSDGITKRQYQKDAAKIAEVQRGILATSQKEEPFDVFICYKETDADTGERSRDSIDAQEVYYQLTEKGYRVFFARVTLEDKAGAEYEPYIFAALNSAKVMIVLGEKPEHFSAVWVKNEWSRYLSLMKRDRSRLLLPCYKNMDPYDLPEQLAVLQSYDMGKIGFIQDLIRGVEKVLKKDEPKVAPMVQQIVQSAGGANITALLQRGEMALEEREWDRAKEYYDKVLDIDAECADAWLGLALAKNKLRGVTAIGKISYESSLRTLEIGADYKKYIRFSSVEQQKITDDQIATAKKRLDEIEHRRVDRRIERQRKKEIKRAKKKEEQVLIQEKKSKQLDQETQKWIPLLLDKDDGHYSAKEIRDMLKADKKPAHRVQSNCEALIQSGQLEMIHSGSQTLYGLKGSKERRLANIKNLEEERKKLNDEINNLKGLFTKKRKTEISGLIDEIERSLAELNSLK